MMINTASGEIPSDGTGGRSGETRTATRMLHRMPALFNPSATGCDKDR